MLEFIKMFGLGILYTILSPLILAIFLLFVIYSFFNYLVLEVVNFFKFFTGRKFKLETKLEQQMKRDIANKQAQADGNSANLNQSQSYLNQNVTNISNLDVGINNDNKTPIDNSKGGDLNA